MVSSLPPIRSTCPALPGERLTVPRAASTREIEASEGVPSGSSAGVSTALCRAKTPGAGSGPGCRPMSATPFIVLSAILFTIGSVGVLTRRNAIVVFMCVELMLNASNLALVTFSRVNGNLDGQIAAFFVMVVAAAEVVVGLAIIVTIFRTRRSASVDDANLLKF